MMKIVWLLVILKGFVPGSPDGTSSWEPVIAPDTFTSEARCERERKMIYANLGTTKVRPTLVCAELVVWAPKQ